MQINTTSDALDNLNKKLGGADIEIEPSTNKVDALKKIYKTLGGTDDVKGLSTVYQVLEKITEVAEGGGGGGIQFAEVTINSSETALDMGLPIFDDETGLITIIGAVVDMPATYKIPLGPNGALIQNWGEYDANIVTGDISEHEGDFVVTGDGTINANFT